MEAAPLVAAVAFVVAACGGGDTNPSETNPATDPASVTAPTSPSTTRAAATDGDCADVIAVEIEGSDGTYDFAVTVASADTGWDKYADAWVVRAPDGAVLGERVLTHPHVDEQPFTRSLGGVAIPLDVAVVVVAARDSVLGFCGEEMSVAVGAAGEGG